MGAELAGHYPANPIDPDRPAYTRQPGEPPKAFEAFAYYRDMGPGRTLSGAARELSKAKTLLQRWAKHYQWHERADAWDAENDRVARETILKERREMAERHAALGSVMTARAYEMLAKMEDAQLDEYIKKNPELAARLADVGVRIERLARGEPTEIGAVDVYEHDEARSLAMVIINDPEAYELADALLGRAAGQLPRGAPPAEPGGAGDRSVER